MRAEINSKLDIALSRIDRLEDHRKIVDQRLELVKSSNDALASQVVSIQEEVSNFKTGISKEVREQVDRNQRKKMLSS